MLEKRKIVKESEKEMQKKMIDAESLLWSKLKRNQLNSSYFYRQKAIGDYITFFYCVKHKLVIDLYEEIDYTAEAREEDRIRCEYFESRGFKVLRLSTEQILTGLKEVMEAIQEGMGEI